MNDSVRDRLARSSEDALGKLAQDLLENPLVNGALSRAFEAREKAVQAQEAAMGALARLEGAGDRAVDERVLEQVLRELADRILARARELVAQTLAVGHRNLAFHGC